MTRGLAGLAALAFLIGLIMGATALSGAERTARSFTSAWERGDYSTMYSLLTPGAKKRVTPQAFRSVYVNAANTATQVGIDAGKVHDDGDFGRVEIAVRTRIFGVVRGNLRVPVVDDHVEWGPELAFPGLARGEALTRRTSAPRRARILSRDGHTIVSGPATARVVAPTAASSIAGEVKPPPSTAEQTALY